ncbi:MAG TPA: hypothetical protein VM307_07760 [Egibacteraceae bacterium]|nr:hypothetical protein [Egibacteraceae bacterium]
MSFDRIKAPDAWQRRQEGPGRDPQGRAALFTGADEAVRAAGVAPPEGFQVHCSRCDTSTAVGAREAVGLAVRMAVPLFLIAPWKSHPVFAVCPSCGVRSWLRVRT